MVDSNWRDTKGAWKPLRAASALNWAKRRPSLTASTKPAPSPPPSLLTSVQTQSISHSLLMVDTLSLRDLAAMATKSRQTFFHFFFFLIEAPPLRHPWRNDWKVTSLSALSDSTQIVFSKTLECLLCERHSSAYTFVFFFFTFKYLNHPQAPTHSLFYQTGCKSLSTPGILTRAQTSLHIWWCSVLRATNAEFQLSVSRVAHNNKLIAWRLAEEHTASCSSSSYRRNTIRSGLKAQLSSRGRCRRFNSGR